MEFTNYFKNLGAHERIEIMCDLFKCCNILELNFYHTYLSGNLVVGQSFVNAQYKASRSVFSSSSTSVYQTVNRRELIAAVVFMGADSGSQAQAIYTIVNAELNDGSERYLRIKDQEVIAELLLLVTLIVQHPAFKYIQIMTFVECLAQLKQKYELRNGSLASPELTDIGATALIPSPIPGEEQVSGEAIPDEPLTKPVISPKSNKQEKVLSVKCRKVAKKRIFVIELTWSSSKQTMVRKAFQDIVNFHQSLLQLHPDVCLFASAGDILNGGTQPQSEAIEKYLTRFFCEVPFRIQNDASIIHFFTSTAKQQPPSLVGISNLGLKSSENSVNFRSSGLPNSNFKSDLPNSNFKSDLPNSNFKSDLPNSNLKSDLLNSNLKSDLLNSNLKSDLPNSNLKSDLPNSNLKSDLLPSDSESKTSEDFIVVNSRSRKSRIRTNGNKPSCPVPVQNQKDYRVPVRNQKDYRVPVRNQKDYRVPVRNQKDCRVPVRNQKDCRVPVRNQDYAVSVQNQKDYAVPVQNQKDYAVPVTSNGRSNSRIRESYCNTKTKVTNYVQLPEVKVVIQSENRIVNDNVVSSSDDEKQPLTEHQSIRPAETQIKDKCNFKGWGSIQDGTTLNCEASQSGMPISNGLVSTVAEMFGSVSHSQAGQSSRMLNDFHGCVWNINGHGVNSSSAKKHALSENKKNKEETKPNKDLKLFANVREFVPFRARPAFSSKVAGVC